MELIAGKYRVLKDLGQGACGKVYLVEHVELGAKCALKMLQPSLTDDGRLIERFKQEANILLQFNHPSSVQMRDFGRTEDGHYYMTMDFCDGKLVKEIIAEHKPVPVEEALDYTQQVLSALSAAHRAGIVHRDIKPDNLMVVRDTEGAPLVKVMDFGISKILGSVKIDSNMTVAGASIGTPNYMSPEQAAGEEDIDGRADIYACGILLYEMLSGSCPFQHDSMVKTLLLQITKPPSEFPASLGIPEQVKKIVFRALKKDRLERYQTADEFRNACLAALEQLKRDCSEESSAMAAPACSSSQKASAEEEDLGKLRIMCLDDDPFILNIMKRLLEQEGYRVFAAKDPAELDRYVFGEGAQMLVSDVQMPGMPGTTVCKLLKLTMPELKIILFSNIDERELENSAREAGADAWMSKNAKPADWIVKIKEVMDR